LQAQFNLAGDIAEWYPVTDNKELRPVVGDIVVLTEDLITFPEPLYDPETGIATGEEVTRVMATIAKATPSTKQYTIGVVSENPYMTIGQAVKDAQEQSVPIVLSGRIPVKISLENGPIRPGDLLTISEETPGAAAKLVGSGQVIGRALEPYNSTGSSGKIMMLVNMYYHYDDTSIVPIFDSKIIDIQAQIDELKARVEDLEEWRAKQEE